MKDIRPSLLTAQFFRDGKVNNRELILKRGDHKENKRKMGLMEESNILFKQDIKEV